MRCLNRNKRTFWYALYEGRKEHTVEDEYGNVLSTGEYEVSYSEPVKTEGNVSTASGATATELFGAMEGYDKVIVIDDVECPIDEHSILWVDTNDSDGAHDYIVKRVARSLNSVAIAISRVEVTANV